MSTEQLTVEQMNKDIAEFMGYEHCNRCDNKDCYRIGSLSYTAAQMKFATHWDWLMPVAQKILNMDSTPFNTYQLYVSDALATANIEQVYRAVYDFITWYKTQQK